MTITQELSPAEEQQLARLRGRKAQLDSQSERLAAKGFTPDAIDRILGWELGSVEADISFILNGSSF